ncbi:MAG: 16S rRNA (uracil(1498)-N(3))-methyltransferase [Candidatus Saganbacteria bacterium]|nr:16S rRNA (uracil(1498)-N(3))-methyltransferase [Candidatus Saganbacteria bacterium]
MQRFFVPASNIKNNLAEIRDSDAYQIQKVLRSKIGDQIIICDGISKSHLAIIKEITKDKITVVLEKEIEENTEPKVKITLAQCLPKGSKIDFVIQKSVELGVFDIIPVISERSIPKISDKAEKKQARWQKIAKEAAEQSGRQIIPKIHLPIFFDDLLSKQTYDLKLIPWELEKENRLRDVLKSVETCHGMSLLATIGPEGGFSQQEINKAKASGFMSISLGKRILRTETAGIAVLSNIFYELEE